jgi:hypothetical protein
LQAVAVVPLQAVALVDTERQILLQLQAARQ